MGLRLRARIGAILVCLTASAGLSLAAAPAASAHPLGNFTVNYFSGIRVEPDALVVELVVDRAEIPTLQAFPHARAGRQPGGADGWKSRECAALAGQATLTVAGTHQALTVTSTRLEIGPGAAGLATSRLECTARTSSPVDIVGKSVRYQAAPTGGRVGWHEVTAVGQGVDLRDSTAPVDSTSKRLTAYPQDLLASPLDQRSATFTVTPGSGRAITESSQGLLSSSPVYGLDRMTSAYTDLVSRTSLTPGFALLALALSMLLGALHAFAPGHGKTLMAAYLVGREGTWRQAAVIGVSVTITHTIGVLLLGVALSAAAIAAPEAVYPWLGMISGLLLTVIGVSLLLSARSGHTHGPGGHTHGPGGHTHGPGGHTHGPAGHTQEIIGQHGPSGPTHEHRDHSHMPGEHAHGFAGQTHEHRDHSHMPGEHAHGFAGQTHELAAHKHGHVVAGAGAAGDPGEQRNPVAAQRAVSAPHHRQGVLTRPGPESPSTIRDDSMGQGQGAIDHGAAQPTRNRRRVLSNVRLAGVGLVGGMVPSPSALLVLLGGIGLGRAWFGAVLVLAYGVGMAAALVGTGLLLVAARDRLARWSSGRADLRPLPGQTVVLLWIGRLPVLTATAVLLLGIWIAVRSISGL